MARREEKAQAIRLRKQGLSYSQIKLELGVSKSTLSNWLSDMPLSKGRVKELQQNESVIEKIRQTKLKKRQNRLSCVFDKVSGDIRKLTEREFLIAGFFLYWAEGGKTTPYSISLSNTDPAMIRCYLKWLQVLKIPSKKIRIRLHLYKDMNAKKETRYWMNEIGVSGSQFAKPYVKNSRLSDLTYGTRGHGTCNVIVNGRDIAEYVHQGIKVISSMY